METGTRAAALGGYTAVHAMANTEPVADTAGVVEQVWRLGEQAGYVDVRPVRRGHRGAARQAARRARRDGRLRGPGPRLFRRRLLRRRPAADAPGARVRQGVRRRDRAARAGAEADRGRAAERGGDVEQARPGPGRPPPRRRSSRGTCCSPRTSTPPCTSATSTTAGSVEIIRWAKSKGWRVTAEVTPHHLLLTDDLAGGPRPAVQGQPAAAHQVGRRGAAARRWPTAPSTAWPPTTPRTRGGQGRQSGRGGQRHDRPGDGARASCSSPWSTPGCSTGPASRTACPRARPRSAACRATASRLAAGAPASRRRTTPRARHASGPGGARLEEPQQPASTGTPLSGAVVVRSCAVARRTRPER